MGTQALFGVKDEDSAEFETEDPVEVDGLEFDREEYSMLLASVAVDTLASILCLFLEHPCSVPHGPHGDGILAHPDVSVGQAPMA
jgi:hypothetical protein